MPLITCLYHSPPLESDLHTNRQIGENAAIQATHSCEHAMLHGFYAIARNSQPKTSIMICTNAHESDGNATLLLNHHHKQPHLHLLGRIKLKQLVIHP